MAAVVPAIPSAALMAIADPNIREVLRAIADGIAVRNGDIGSGDHAFLTLADFKTDGTLQTAIVNALAIPIAEGIASPSSKLKLAAEALQARILQSAAWLSMFQRLTLIDAPSDIPGSFAYNLAQKAKTLGVAIDSVTEIITSIDEAIYKLDTGVIARIGRAETGITDEVDIRANKDNALASAINTMWAAFGDNEALIQDGELAAANVTGSIAEKWTQLQAVVQDPETGLVKTSAALREEMTVSNTAVDGLKAKWGVKIDLGTPGKAYVSGVSLNAGVNPDGVPDSSFIVLADVFAIGAPGRPDIVPFAIDVNTGLVSIRGDLFVRGSIEATSMALKTITAESGVIGDLAVDTLQIAGNAVTVPSSVFSSYPTGSISTGEWETVLELDVDFGLHAPSAVIVIGSVNTLAMTGGSAGGPACRFTQDGIAGPMEVANSLAGGYSGILTLAEKFTSGSGVHNYKMQLKQTVGSTIYMAGSRNFVVIGAKR